jgi:D-cysteine desulfhydrase
MRELAGQIREGPVQIVLAVGSCGTFAGAILGAKLFMPQARVIGISISRTSGAIARRTAEVMNECARLLNIDPPAGEESVESYDQYFQEYGVMTESGREAILTCARLEGILLDPIYTGKAMAGLMDLAARDVIDREVPTIFLHTGGLPILFAFEREFRRVAGGAEI